MTSAFTIRWDSEMAVLRVMQQGFWSMADFQAYLAQLSMHHERLMRTRGRYRMLSDCANFPVQSAEVTEAFRIQFTKLHFGHSIRCAIIAGSTLNKLQASRALPQSQVRTFLDRTQALAWLMAPDCQSEGERRADLPLRLHGAG